MTEQRAGLPILAFEDMDRWLDWIARQPEGTKGLWLKIAKAGNARSRLTKAQAIDGALIHGWIDGQLNPYDGDWYLIRFTPRKARSKWSQKNRERVTELIGQGRVTERGMAEVEAAKGDGRWDAAYAPASTATVPDDLAAALEANPAARAFFDGLNGANRYAILYRIGDAEKPETRAARIAKFVAMCAEGKTVH
ncbi:YdeI/OmpD-associated family protein [Sphingomonas rhizophila]|uniref:YdeI/OmpD-associated family protein n=1 Tax=Sphingomonas rhizophila TaxID=2071607 RepID=A0A7G9S9L6_9SPHN|nr:YdeI/OmpD-associated family protein [Sphingomonas rhizophila]QNN64541.1 YdeI/OmpD-associated family protein [Sphingomonas rhizophila]